ncbi:hypothetical protein SDC9_176639 [bioreactor metagenome]|uniref:Uncharacterized protein n=1 Tax=bioreactor metagenome TaxID=1076179 RepID=A0A645GQL6_9ZZZZ
MDHIGRVLEAHGRAGVEAKPSQPQDKQTDHRQRHAVALDGLGLSMLVIFAVAGSKNDGTGQGRPAADRVNDRVAREIKETQIRQPAAAPYPVADDRIDNKRQNK